MATPTGDERDLYVIKFTDAIEHELQQETSLLRAVVRQEPGVMGKQTMFTRKAKQTAVAEVTENFALRNPSTAAYERRIVSPTPFESVYFTGELDLMKMASNPKNDIVIDASRELGRKIDSVIYAAFSADAAREVNGSISNAVFDTNNTIAVADNAFSALTGDTGLHPGKLMKAKSLLAAAHVDLSRQEIFVVGNSKQFTKLQYQLKKDGEARKDFLSKTALTIPGIDIAIDGYLGLRYVTYEEVGLDGSNDEYVYVLTRDAIRLGFWQEVKGKIATLETHQLSPEIIVHNMKLGAVRMDESQIVRIACDPA